VGLSPYDWHVFEVERVGAYLYFYLDRLTRPSYLFSLFDIGCTGRNIFLGNKYSGGSTTWSSLGIVLTMFTLVMFWIWIILR